MDRICPKCGITSSKRGFVGDFCVDCYASRIELDVPRGIVVQRCHSCGRVRTKEWVWENEKNVQELVLSRCRGKYASARVRLEPEPHITFIVNASGSFVEIVRNFELKFENVTCPECSRKTSGYYEAIVQIRGDPEKIEKLGGRIARKLEKATSISKVEELKEGTDFYVVSKKAAAETLSELGFRFTTSNKLFGVKDGQRVYRTTFCVRV